MRQVLLFFLLVSLFACQSSEEVVIPADPFPVTTYAPVAVAKDLDLPVFAHYMPWFESPDFAEFGNGNFNNWGIHWTMSLKNPENINSEGKREIASHYYPLIGPYDNGEPHYLEYAVVCMKLTGIDGLLIDWAGTTEVYDGKLLHDHTQAIIPWLEKAGLQFAVVYEDASLQNALNQGLITNMATEGGKVMSYLKSFFFSQDHYLHLDDQPVVLNFGPQGLKSNAEWEQALSNAGPVRFFPLSYHAEYFDLTTVVDGAFAWVGESINEDFYNYCEQFNYCIGGAMPGFEDYYFEGGWGNGYTTYDPLDGQLFEETFNRALNQSVDLLQLITWNDWGEGTQIEPALEYGYQRLEQVQNKLGVPYSSEDLELAIKLYEKRKENVGNSLVNKKLDQVFYHLVSLQIEEARLLLEEI